VFRPDAGVCPRLVLGGFLASRQAAVAAGSYCGGLRIRAGSAALLGPGSCGGTRFACSASLRRASLRHAAASQKTKRAARAGPGHCAARRRRNRLRRLPPAARPPQVPCHGKVVCIWAPLRASTFVCAGPCRCTFTPQVQRATLGQLSARCSVAQPCGWPSRQAVAGSRDLCGGAKHRLGVGARSAQRTTESRRHV
jgi:hypothetical protein